MNSIKAWYCMVLCLSPLWCLATAVGVGSSAEELVAEFGDPEMQYSRSGDRILFYLGLEVVVRDGKVVQIPSQLSERITGKRTERKKAAALRMKDQARRSPRVHRATSAGNHSGSSAASGSARVVSNGGARVDLESLMKPGHVTVVDFYADWCGPCRQLAPHLEQLADSDANVDLVKVDIVKWGTPVTKQYAIESVPNVRVYNASGTIVGKPSHSLTAIRKNIAQAK